MKRVLLLASLVAIPAFAQDTTPATPTTPPNPVIPVPPVTITIQPPTSTELNPTPSTPPLVTAAPAFLTERGIVTSAELVEKLNAKLTPEQRAQLDQALAKRNAALAKANDELTATLRDLLRETNEGLTRRVDEGDEARRMERMKRLQPGRYQQLMRQKKQDEKAAKAKEQQKPQ